MSLDRMVMAFAGFMVLLSLALTLFRESAIPPVPLSAHEVE